MPSGFLNDGHNYDLRFLNLLDYDNVKAYREMLQNIEYIRDVQVPLMEDPGPVFDLIESGAIYGYKRGKLGKEPIIILNVRKALDLGFQEPVIVEAILFMITYA